MEEEKKDRLMKLKFNTEEEVKVHISMCEGKHIQQVIYSTYHKAMTQICFGCGVIRTSLNEEIIG